MKPMAHRHLPPAEPPRAPLPALLIGGLALVVWAWFFLVMLPGLA